MKSFIKYIASISLAFLVLFSTISFSVNKHYCGGELAFTSFFMEDDCGMDSSNTFSDECSVENENCCKNIVKTITGQDDLKFDKANFSFANNIVFIYKTHFIELKSIASKTIENISFSKKPDPPSGDKIYILTQEFLI